MAHRIIRFETIPSTSDYLKSNYRTLSDGDVALAHHQSQGHGRLGRVWEDDEGSLLFSILLKDHLKTESAHLIPLLAGAACLEAYKTLGLNPMVKWPNDILIDGKKSAGIIAEGVSQTKLEAIVVGIGVNVNNTHFPEPLKQKATSLSLALHQVIDPEEVLERILTSFDSLYKDYSEGNDTFIPIIKAHSYLDGREVFLNYYDERKKVKVQGIQNDGRLLVLEGEKELLLEAGEVSLENVYPTLK